MYVPIYDDEYMGTRWAYGLKYRPITQYIGLRDDNDEVIPWILYSSQRHAQDPRYPWGIVDTTAPLSKRTCEQLQIEPV